MRREKRRGEWGGGGGGGDFGRRWSGGGEFMLIPLIILQRSHTRMERAGAPRMKALRWLAEVERAPSEPQEVH